MQSLATEIDEQKALENMANAISRLENALAKIRSKNEARNQIIDELNGCVSSLEQFLNNSK